MATNIQFSFRHQPYRFTLKPGFFLLCLFFFVLMCWLGIWQLQRYHFKTLLLASYQQRLAAAPISLLQLPPSLDQIQFQATTATGHYLANANIFVQNQLHHDQMGFEVLTPFQVLGTNTLLLVDRGWIASLPKQTIPTVANVVGEQQIVGYIKVLNEYQFTLGKNILNPNARPLVIQKIDFKELEQVTQQVFYPFVLRLDAKQAHGFMREWTITTMPPGRHLAYAVQWFVMAIVLFIAFLCFSVERVK